MFRELGPGFRLTLVLTILTGLLYPAVMTGVSELIFPKQANGSLVTVNGKVVGSSLIGQAFAKPEYFHPRPSSAGSGYDATASSGSNLGPTSAKLLPRHNQNGRQGKLKSSISTALTIASCTTASITTSLTSHRCPSISSRIHRAIWTT